MDGAEEDKKEERDVDEGRVDFPDGLDTEDELELLVTLLPYGCVEYSDLVEDINDEVFDVDFDEAADDNVFREDEDDDDDDGENVLAE